jgi:ATP synthase F1 gamma subunit
LRTLDALHDAVTAMKSLSGHHFRVARQALPAARVYRERIDRLLDEVGLPAAVPHEQPRAVFLVSSDLGLCGDYNSRLAATASELLANRPGRVYCVGQRGARALRRQGFAPDRDYSAATSVEGLQTLLLDVAEDLLDDYAAGHFGSLVMVSARLLGAGHFTPGSSQLLPIPSDARPGSSHVSPYVRRATLQAVAIREYLFIALYESLLDALAAEHGMRLVATENAEQWLERTTGNVKRQIANWRLEAATQELLDLVAPAMCASARGNVGEGGRE